MWGEAGNSSQDLFQVGILLIAVSCIPVMLFPKPCIEISRNKKIMKDHPLLEEEMDDERNGVNHSDDLSLRLSGAIMAQDFHTRSKLGSRNQSF